MLPTEQVNNDPQILLRKTPAATSPIGSATKGGTQLTKLPLSRDLGEFMDCLQRLIPRLETTMLLILMEGTCHHTKTRPL